MVISLAGRTVVTSKCPHCDRGNFVRDPAGKVLGHYQPTTIYVRSGIAFETSAACPGRGKRAYGSRVCAAYRSQALIKAMRQIINWQD